MTRQSEVGLFGVKLTRNAQPPICLAAGRTMQIQFISDVAIVSTCAFRDATDNAEDFKQGAMFEKAADTHAADGTLLKIPLC